MKTTLTFLVGIFLQLSAFAQWQDASNVSISGDILTSTTSYASYIRTSSTIKKPSGGYFTVKWLPDNSNSIYRYIGLSEPSSSASTESSMVYYFRWYPGVNQVHMYAHGSQVASLSYPFNNPTPLFHLVIEDEEVKYFVDGILRYTYGNSANIPSELKGHIKFYGPPDEVEATFLAFPASTCGCEGGSSSGTEPILWSNTHDVVVDGDLLVSQDNSLAYAMTSVPISTSLGGEYEIDVVDAGYDDIWIGLTDDVNSSNSSNTMDFKINYESSYNDIIGYVNGSSVYNNSNGPALATFKYVIGESTIDYVVNDIVFYTYSGVLPDELYLHIIFTDPDKVAVTMNENEQAVPLVWGEESNFIYHDGPTVGLNTTTPDTNYALDVVGDIKSLNGNSTQWNAAYLERGSAIAGTGLIWDVDHLELDGAGLLGDGLEWNAATNVFSIPSSIAGSGLSWSNGQLSVTQSSVWNESAGTVYYTGGTVAIGTSSVPTGYQMAVDGHLIAEELTVEVVAGTGPDYVFEENYELISLQEVRNHISDKGHLPEVPSALEMEENGISVSEMNMLLLKKIEELTLYILDQEERINKLEGKK